MCAPQGPQGGGEDWLLLPSIWKGFLEYYTKLRIAPDPGCFVWLNDKWLSLQMSRWHYNTPWETQSWDASWDFRPLFHSVKFCLCSYPKNMWMTSDTIVINSITDINCCLSICIASNIPLWQNRDFLNEITSTVKFGHHKRIWKYRRVVFSQIKSEKKSKEVTFLHPPMSLETYFSRVLPALLICL